MQQTSNNMLAHKLLITVTLLLATYNVVAQDCNSTAGFITNIADFPTTDLVFVNYTDYISWGDATGPALFNFTDEISVEFPDSQSQFYGGGWGLGANGGVAEYVSGINYPGSYSILFAKPAFYFATRLNYSPDDLGGGYPVVTFYNAANESVACYDLETIAPIRTNDTGELIFRGFYNAQGFSKVTFEGAYLCNADILVRYTAAQAPVAAPVASPVETVNAPVNSPVTQAPVATSPKSPVAKTSSAASMMALSALPFIAAVLFH